MGSGNASGNAPTGALGQVVMASDVQLPWGSCTDQKNSDEGVKL